MLEDLPRIERQGSKPPSRASVAPGGDPTREPEPVEAYSVRSANGLVLALEVVELLQDVGTRLDHHVLWVCRIADEGLGRAGRAGVEREPQPEIPVRELLQLLVEAAELAKELA